MPKLYLNQELVKDLEVPDYFGTPETIDGLAIYSIQDEWHTKIMWDIAEYFRYLNLDAVICKRKDRSIQILGIEHYDSYDTMGMVEFDYGKVPEIRQSHTAVFLNDELFERLPSGDTSLLKSFKSADSLKQYVYNDPA